LGGKVTCTLGEVKNRADFIIYWGGNPAECHPRHFTKYTLTQKGKFVPLGRKGRTMITIDIRETPSARAADIALIIKPGKDFELATTIRALMKGQPVDEARVAEIGLPLETIKDLVERMKRAKFGVIFFGMGVSMTRGKHMNSAGLLNIAAEMNAFTKFVCMPMRGHGNVTGADVVLRWTTGYPFGVSLSRGYPRFNPGEFSTIDLLVRGDTDATLVLGADPGATMPQPAIDHLTRTPTIVMDPKTAVTGVSAAGTAYRMDEIPFTLRPGLKSPYPTDEQVINLLLAAVAKKPAWRPAPSAVEGPAAPAQNTGMV
jgi:formylmethanofuran dehydrogenase subunit B